MAKLNSREVDARFHPILEAIDEITARFDVLAGEQVYMLTVVLVGCIDGAPPDVRDLFTDAVIAALRLKAGALRRLEDVCLRGTVPRL